MPLRFASLLIAVLALPAAAQAPPTPACAPGEAEARLDAAGAAATLSTRTGLFPANSSGYQAPKRTRESTVFTATPWVSGLVDGEFRMAGSQYGPYEFWPGPLDASGTTTAADCAAADRIWVVATADVDAFEGSGTATGDLAEWPVGLGAPFYVDGNGNGRQDAAEPTVALDPGDPGYGARTIDLAAGERPVIFGRQTAWWVVNDAGGVHERYGTAPLGVELRITAWAHGSAAAPEVGRSTFYRYEVINRSAATLDSVRVSLFADVDLRNYRDDRVHSDTARQMVVVYDAEDDGSTSVSSPPEAPGRSPAFGIDVLSGGATGAMAFRRAAGVLDTPNDAEGVRLLMQSRWRDGAPLLAGGMGHPDVGGSGPRERWSFPGDPVTQAFWSEENDGATGISHFGDSRVVVPSGPARLAPGERMTVDFGMHFAEGVNRLDAVTQLRAVSDAAQSLYGVGALTAPVAPPAPLAAPVLSGPADGDTLTTGPLRLAWERVPGATEYLVQVSAGTDGWTPIFLRTTAPEVTLDRYRLPLNRTDPFSWTVRALSPITESEASEPMRFVYDVPAFTSFEVVANASGRLAEPALVGYVYGPGGFPATDQQATTDVDWSVGAVDAEQDGYGAFLSVAVPEDDRSTFPRDFEMRFTGTSQAVIVPGGRALTVPFELWDIGSGTPDDPRDDVRLIPIVHDLDADGAFSASPLGASSRSRTDGVTWALPLDRTPGQRGYLAWAAAPTESAQARGPEVLRRVLLTRFGAVSGTESGEHYPEVGTVIRIVSSGRARALPEPVAPETLVLGVRPNPSSTRATVGYRLEADAEVRLRVVDVLGREVAVLAEGPRTAGAHTAALDASRLAAGVYVLELRAGDARTVQTITVAR